MGETELQKVRGRGFHFESIILTNSAKKMSIEDEGLADMQQELTVIIDLTITINICLANHLVNLLVRQLLSYTQVVKCISNDPV